MLRTAHYILADIPGLSDVPASVYKVINRLGRDVRFNALHPTQVADVTIMHQRIVTTISSSCVVG